MRLLAVLTAFAAVAAACTDRAEDLPATAATPPATTSSAAASRPPDTSPTVAGVAPTTAITSPGPTTVAVRGDLPDGLAEAVAAVYDLAAGISGPGPSLPAGLANYVSAVPVPFSPVRQASYHEARLPDGSTVAVVVAGPDVFPAVDDGDGWRLVGAALGGHPPWLMEEPGLLLVIGSDARPGQLQPRFRADSIHVLALSPSRDAGTIVGFPRDTYISAEIIAAANASVGLPDDDLPPGGIKWTNLMAGRGPEIMLETARVLTGLPIDGYVLAGFLGFEELIDSLGGLRITLPSDLRSGNNWEDFSAGTQVLGSRRALQLARIRKGLRRGDFDRSLNQGLIMLAAMTMAQERGVEALPELVRTLAENTFTDLSPGELLSFAAAGLLMSPGGLANVVLPGDVTTIDRRSVVLLHDDEMARVLADVADDGLLATEQAP